jgi:hypothetical protein
MSDFSVNGLRRPTVSILISEGRCPVCLGRLDALLKCFACNWDAGEWIKASREDYERSANNREG